MLTKDNYIATLLAVVPEFEPVYQEHLADNEGELLTHVLFGDLFDFALTAHQEGNSNLLVRIIRFINQVAGEGDEDMTEVAHVSFMEYVPSSPINEVIQPLLNEATATMYQQIVTWKPEPDVRLAS
jgi:hypothetical protein